MFRSKNILILLSVACYTICESAFVDTLSKCDYKDQDCLKKEIKAILEGIATTGIPENDIPPIDPLEIKDLKLNLLNILQITIVEGTIKGIKKCELDDFKLNLEKGKVELKLICDIIAKGKYDVSGSNPALKELIGGNSVHGNGNAKLKIEKLMVKFEYKLDIVKRDGEIYIDSKKEFAKYDYDILGDSKIQMDHLFVGDVESSQILADYYNNNAKTLWKTFGKSVMDTVAGMVYDFMRKFFAVVPTKYYLGGDLTPFIKQ